MLPPIVIRPANNFSFSIPGSQRAEATVRSSEELNKYAWVGTGDWLVGWFCVILLACEPTRATVPGSYLIRR